MSIEYPEIKPKSIIWRNLKLPHPQKTRKSPEFCINGLVFYFESYGNYKQTNYEKCKYEETWDFNIKCLGNPKSLNYIIVPYVAASTGRYVRLAYSIANTPIWISHLSKIVGSEKDTTITMLFLFLESSLSIEVNLNEAALPISKDNVDLGKESNESQSWETDSDQSTSIENSTTPDSCTNCDKEAIQTLCLKGLSEDIGKLFNDIESADATLKCADKSFSVHRRILAARSEVFSAMFKHDLSEKNTGVVDIVDLNSNILEQFLRYLYSGKIELMSMDIALELYQVADKYSVRTLKQLCASYILDNMSKDIVYEVLVLADKAGDVEFMDGITSFAVKIEGFLKSKEWKEFAEKFPNVAVKVYFKHLE